MAAELLGRIVNISSVGGVRWSRKWGSAVLHHEGCRRPMSEVLAVESAQIHHQCQLHRPGRVHSEMMDGMIARTDESHHFPAPSHGGRTQLDLTLPNLCSPT